MGQQALVSVVGTVDYSAVVRMKIQMLYLPNEENLTKAVERIVRVREQICALLDEVVQLVDTEEMTNGVSAIKAYLDKSGFYYRPSSANGHHNFPGGLAEHCLGVCNEALRVGTGKYPRKSLIICGLFHDICKADRFYFVGREIRAHRASGYGHSERSVLILKDHNFPLEEVEANAIYWHMKLYKANRHPFARLIFDADKQDCRNIKRKRTVRQVSQ